MGLSIPMRKWLLRIHLYGGLLCAPYLIIFGFSSLHFNHHFPFVTPAPNSAHWEAPLTVEPIQDNEAMSQAVRDSLGLMGWTIPWRTKRDAAGDLEFDLERPGKSYTIRTLLKEKKVQVEEHHKGFWQVVNSLHGIGALPNSKFVPWWGIYTEICTWFVVFAGASGIYLWLNSQRERRLGICTLAAAMVVSFGLIAFVVIKG
jgi:hypothetical protein